MSMTTVEQFVTVLTHLILAVGELEEGVDLVKVAQRPGTQERPMSAEEIGGWDREMWEKKEEDMRGLYEDLQRIRGCWEVMMAGWGRYVYFFYAASHELAAPYFVIHRITTKISRGYRKKVHIANW